jgi:asparagine synthase (glutamine-hydrolysing)
MSGIVGIANRDNIPPDRELLEKLVNFLAFRGPDAQNTWADGQVAFGHALLRTTPEPVDEKQPCSLDGRFWITAEARLDDAEQLRRRLAETGISFPESDSDARLILGAYRQWGEECLQYLAGDFVFAIWDQEKRRLFCARDHFGVRPFFYADLGHAFVFSNTLACLRRHPEASRKLDDAFMADWLLADQCRDPERTAFTNLRRLPAAHSLTWDATGFRVRRYWMLPTEHSLIRFAHPQDYVEEFRRLLKLAIRDRLRTPDAAVFMSGGLDSTTLAAVTHSHLKEMYGESRVRAHVQVFERLIKDQENSWSRRAAAGIGIPIDVTVIDNYAPFPGWLESGNHALERDGTSPPRWGLQPEPLNDPLLEPLYDTHRTAASHARVAMTGSGPDASLAWPLDYFFAKLRRGNILGVIQEIAGYWREYGHHPPLGLRWLVTESWRAPPPWTAYPTWLNERFAARMDMRSRYQALVTPVRAAHKTRSLAYRSLASHYWSLNFEYRDSGITGVPLSMTHPFFDLRLMNYCLSLPPLPWCIRKEIVRQAATGFLPEEIRHRPKATFPSDPAIAVFRQLDHATLSRYTLPEVLDPYIRREAAPQLPELCGEQATQKPWVDYRPFGLAYWIQQQKGSLSIS